MKTCDITREPRRAYRFDMFPPLQPAYRDGRLSTICLFPPILVRVVIMAPRPLHYTTLHALHYSTQSAQNIYCGIACTINGMQTTPQINPNIILHARTSAFKRILHKNKQSIYSSRYATISILPKACQGPN